MQKHEKHFNLTARGIWRNRWKFWYLHLYIEGFFSFLMTFSFWLLSSTLMDATSTFCLAFNPETRVSTQPTFPCWIQINLHCVCAQTTSCMQTCSLLMGAGNQKKKKKLFLLLTSNPILLHPHPPLTQHGAATGERGWWRDGVRL